MDSNRDEGGVDIGRQRKFGLPSWMVNNMERLNYVTDFEQYGCSPPETESFLTEWAEGSRYADSTTTEDQPVLQGERVSPMFENRQCSDLRSPLERPSLPNTFLANLRQDDCLVSSPDSTPCATPEPSPMVRRKVSIPHPGDTVLTNPGRWFYFGKLKKASPTSQTPPTSDNESTDSVDRPKKSRGVKLVISNFDLNAVSPNSW